MLWNNPLFTTLSWDNPILTTVLWSAITIILFLIASRLYKRWPLWWLSPLATTPVMLIILTLLLHVSYTEYISGTHWLVSLLGPATVAFAIPIYEQRELIRKYWAILSLGVVVGSVVAIGSGWLLATALGLSDVIRTSLLPRSITTPFAMTVSGDFGGAPDLTAVFVVATGVFGAVIGQFVLHYLPLKSALARGALFGAGAHGAGVAKANEVGAEEGAVAGLVMVMTGIFNVLLAILFITFIHHPS